MIELVPAAQIRAILTPERLAIIKGYEPMIMWGNETIDLGDGEVAAFLDAGLMDGGTRLIVEVEKLTLAITFRPDDSPIITRVQKRTVMKPVEVWEVIQKVI